MNFENILTVKESAKFLGITEQRLYRLMHLKRIEYVKYIKYAYFTKEELERFQAENFKVVGRKQSVTA